jgi:hypothetical protein
VFEGVPDETVETPAFHGLHGTVELVPLAHRKDLRVRAFPVTTVCRASATRSSPTRRS